MLSLLYIVRKKYEIRIELAHCLHILTAAHASRRSITTIENVVVGKTEPTRAAIEQPEKYTEHLFLNRQRYPPGNPSSLGPASSRSMRDTQRAGTHSANRFGQTSNSWLAITRSHLIPTGDYRTRQGSTKQRRVFHESWNSLFFLPVR